MSYLGKFVIGLIALGAILMLSGFISSGFRLDALDRNGPYEDKTYTADASDVKAIAIHDFDHSIVFSPSTDGRVHIAYQEGRLDRYDIAMDNSGQLTMRYQSNRPWYHFIGINLHFPKEVRVQLPADLAAQVTVKTTNGRVEAQDLKTAALDFTTTNGKIALRGMTCLSVQARTTNGAVAFEDVALEGALTASTTNGSMTVTSTRAERIDVHTSNGKIAVQRIQADHISLTTTNGGITGTLIGDPNDYRIEHRTTNGSTHVPTGGNGDKTLTARTTNGAIKLSFEAQ